MDVVIFDCRHQSCAPQLRNLIANIALTTRVMAIVAHLPEDDIFVESGVVYLTPPVNLRDINWFLRSFEEQSGYA